MSDNFTGFESEEPKLPSIGGLEGIADPATKKALTAIKEVLEIRLGTRPRTSALDKAVTFRDLFKYNFASIRVNGIDVINQNPDTAVRPIGNGGTPNSGTPTVDVPNDTVIPGAPLGLIATGTKLAVLLEWDAPGTTIAFAEVHRSDVDNIGNAVLIGSTQSTLYGDIIGETGITRYYWIRFVNTAGIAGPFNSVNGTEATTGRLGSNDLISVDGAKIIDATILDAKIGSVSADKITTGTLLAGQTIQVGNALNRIFIHGSGIIRSAGALDFANGTGFWQGVTGGVPKWFVGSPSKYFAWDGNNPYIQSDNLTLTDSQLIFNGSGTFNGDGVFSGDLSAAGGTFAGALDAASGTFNGELFAATGTFGGRLLAGVLDLTELEGFRQVYTVPNTYSFTVPDGKNTLRFTLCGGAGGGGSNNYNGPNEWISDGGGGGGAANVIVITVPDIPDGTVLTVVVGAGGLGGQPFSDGGNGQSSTVVGGPVNLIAQGGIGGGLARRFRNGTFGGGTSLGGAGGEGGQRGADGGASSYYVTGSGITQRTVFVHGLGGAGGVSTNGGANGGKGANGQGQPGANINRAGFNGGNGRVIIEAFNPNAVVLQTEYDTLLSALQRQGIQTV